VFAVQYAAGVAAVEPSGESQGDACQECFYQAARTFSRNPDVDWKFDPALYPPAFKQPKPEL